MTFVGYVFGTILVIFLGYITLRLWSHAIFKSRQDFLIWLRHFKLTDEEKKP